MHPEIIAWSILIWRSIRGNFGWMSWNLFLAFVPLILSLWLFRKQQSRSIIWWLGFLVFIAFLPNAPYVLTDIIHLVQDVRTTYSVWIITLAVIPQYIIFCLAGFGAYVISLINLGYYLRSIGRRKWILPTELTLHFLSAIGVYLGRFKRFNSWDFITQLDELAATVDDLVAKRPLLVIFITFTIITGLYWISKQIILAISIYRNSKKSDIYSIDS